MPIPCNKAKENACCFSSYNYHGIKRQKVSVVLLKVF